MKKMQKFNYGEIKYTVNGRNGFDLTTALRLWKTKYADDYRDFQKAVIIHDSLKDFDQFVKECWDTVVPFTVEDAFKVENAEERRIYFDAIGIEKLFKSLEPELLDRQVIKKKRARWDGDNKEYTNEFEDVYELYKIEAKKLFPDSSSIDSWRVSNSSIYAVRCWCTTTNREYWLYVTREAALGGNWWYSDETERSKPDAIRAIAWTIRVDVHEEDIEKIYRQGDIIVVKMKDDADISKSTLTPYHLEKEQYLSLMYSET